MNKNKSKKRLFTIIAGSILAFALTVALSVSVTLSYFGATGTGTSTVTMGGSVLVGNALTMTGETVTAVPGQTVQVGATAAVSSSATQSAVAVMLVRVTASSGFSATGTLTGVTNWTKNGTVTKNNNTYDLYVYGTTASMTVINATTTATNVALNGSYQIPTTITNTDAGSTLTYDFIFVVAQNGTTNLNVTPPAYTDVATILQDVGGYTASA